MKVYKYPLSLIKRLRLWWNNYKIAVSKRLEYLDKISKE